MQNVTVKLKIIILRECRNHKMWERARAHLCTGIITIGNIGNAKNVIENDRNRKMSMGRGNGGRVDWKRKAYCIAKMLIVKSLNDCFMIGIRSQMRLIFATNAFDSILLTDDLQWNLFHKSLRRMWTRLPFRSHTVAFRFANRFSRISQWERGDSYSFLFYVVFFFALVWFCPFTDIKLDIHAQLGYIKIDQSICQSGNGR